MRFEVKIGMSKKDNFVVSGAGEKEACG